MGELKFDKIFQLMGECGPFQILVVVLLMAFGGSFQSGFQNVGMNVMQLQPEFECSARPTSAGHFGVIESIQVVDQRCKTNSTDRCRFRRKFLHGDHWDVIDDTCTSFTYNVSKYDTDTSKNFSSFVTEYNLVCDDSNKNTVTKSMYFIGFLLGALLAGYLSDNYGRRLPMILGSLLTFIFSALAAHPLTSYTWWHYTIYRVLIGISANLTYIPSYVMIMEIIGTESIRSNFGVFVQGVFALGMATISLYMYIFRDWRTLQFQFGLASLPGVVMAMFVPESIRYLVSKGKMIAAKETILRIGNNNGTTIFWEQLDFMDEDKSVEKDGGEDVSNGNVSVIQLFTYSSAMTSVVCNVILQWFVNSTIYYGLSLGIAGLPGSIYRTNAIYALVEIPAYGMTMLLLTTCNVGRRYCHGHLMILTGTCCLLSTLLSHLSFCDKELPQYKEKPFSHPLILASFLVSSVGKFSVAATFAIIYNYTTELFPTRIRTNAVAIGSSISRIGAAMSPLILGLYAFRNWLPGTLFGLMGITAGLMTFKLPETRGHPMLMTFEQAQELYEPTKTKDYVVSSKPSMEMRTPLTPFKVKT